ADRRNHHGEGRHPARQRSDYPRHAGRQVRAPRSEPQGSQECQDLSERGTMAGEAPSLGEIRLRLIELIEADEWRITEKAERMGREFLRPFLPVSTQLSIVNHILKLLKQPDCTLIEVPLGTPRGSRGNRCRT